MNNFVGNRRESGGSTGSNISAQHLSPPDLSVRRFYSDPSLHQTVNGVQQASSPGDQTNPVSDTSGSQTIVPTQMNQEHINPNISFGNTLGGVSPLQNASPTISRRGRVKIYFITKIFGYIQRLVRNYLYFDNLYFLHNTTKILKYVSFPRSNMSAVWHSQ